MSYMYKKLQNQTTFCPSPCENMWHFLSLPSWKFTKPWLGNTLLNSAFFIKKPILTLRVKSVIYIFMEKTLRKLVFSLILVFLAACSGPKTVRLAESEPAPAKPPPVKTSYVKSSPANPRAYYYFLLSQFKLREGKLEEGISDLKEAIRMTPGTPLSTLNWPISTSIQGRSMRPSKNVKQP